jgi:Putative antitoxin of bacterial toxin-antitoxin system, YdaS/YdaT
METFRTYLKENRGTQTRLARHLGLSDATVCNWKTIPFEHLTAVSEFTGLTLEVLLPPSRQIETAQ